MSHYFRTLFRAIRGVDLVSYQDYVSHRLEAIRKSRAEHDIVRGERDRAYRDREDLMARYKSLVAECTRHRELEQRLSCLLEWAGRHRP